MRIFKIQCCLLLAAFFLSACSKIHFLELEPIFVKANAKDAHVYRGSYQKLTDIIHTDLDISFNCDSTLVYGKAELKAKPYFYPSNELILDAKGFDLKTVQLKKDNSYQDLKYTYRDNKLKINLDKTYQATEDYIVSIVYTAQPQKLKVGKDISSNDDRGLYFINPKGTGNKPQQIWTQGETENNSTWFPTIEDPAEKMTHHFNITVDDRFTTLSNGILIKSVKNANGQRTDYWEMNQPHSVYLSMLAVGEFEITKDEWRGKSLNYMMEKQYAPYAKSIFGNTPKMLDFFSDILDYPYPWSKYDQVVVRDFISGAMENTTATVLYDQLNITDRQHADNNQDDIIAHELFHHWFGDLVTAESWTNLPLNESFATYAEYLWREYKNDKADAEFHLIEDARAYFNQAKQKDEDVIRYDYADKEQMFDAISYQKGSLILHALRKEVGDDAFFKSLNYYLKTNAYKTAEIHDLRLAFEEVTGKDLNWFFKQWFLAKGNPILKIEKQWNADKGELLVKVSQVQDTTKAPIYKLPLSIDYLDKDLKTHQVNIDQQQQEFRFLLDEQPKWINVTSGNLLVKIEEELKSENDYSLQYQFSKDFIPRFEAVRYFNTKKKSTIAADIFNRALRDEAWPIIYLGLVNYKKDKATWLSNYDLISGLAKNHYHSLVRAEAVKVLRKYYSRKQTKELFQSLKSDKSLLVKKALR